MKTIFNTALWVTAALLSVNAWAETLDETRSVASDATVSVSNIAGEIVIRTWDRNEVHLTGTLGENQELEIIENAQGLQIEVRQIEDRRRSDESNLELDIPVRASIVAVGVSADISIEGSLGATVSAESVSGDVDVEAESDRIEINSVSGDVTFTGATTRIAAEAVSGDIELSGVSGEVAVSTVSGDVEVDAGQVSDGSFGSVSGTLDVALSVADGGRISIENMSGDVHLRLPEGQGGSIEAQSFSGDVDSVFGEVEHDSFGPGSHLKHVSGDSGTSIRVESFSGDIRIGHK